MDNLVMNGKIKVFFGGKFWSPFGAFRVKIAYYFFKNNNVNSDYDFYFD